MQTVVKSLFLTVILYLMLEQAASEAKPDPQFQFGPFVFHPIKRGPRYDCSKLFSKWRTQILTFRPSYFHHQQRQYRPRNVLGGIFCYLFILAYVIGENIHLDHISD